MKIITIVVFLLSWSFIGVAQERNSILRNPELLESYLALNNVWGMKVLIGYSNKQIPIYGYYYNKNGTDKALIISGVHGSEFYGVDVVNTLKDSLDNMNVTEFKWKVLIIPEILPDNVIEGRNNKFKENYGRKTCEICHGQEITPECKKCVDPNRQMPKINAFFNIGDSISNSSEKIELENQFLIQITQKFDPTRILSVHCKNSYKKNEIGIYADPRTNSDNIALGFSEDALLILKMAYLIKENQGVIFGNFIDEIISKPSEKEIKKQVSYFNAVYPQDPPAANKGEKQERSYESNGGKVSFGTWASTEIQNDNKILKKAAITITVELPQYYYFFDDSQQDNSLRTKELKTNTIAYVKAIKEVFLEVK